MSLICEETVLGIHPDAVVEHSDLVPKFIHGTSFFTAHNIVYAVIDVYAFALPSCKLSAGYGILFIDLSLKA